MKTTVQSAVKLIAECLESEEALQRCLGLFEVYTTDLADLRRDESIGATDRLSLAFMTMRARWLLNTWGESQAIMVAKDIAALVTVMLPKFTSKVGKEAS